MSSSIKSSYKVMLSFWLVVLGIVALDIVGRTGAGRSSGQDDRVVVNLPSNSLSAGVAGWQCTRFVPPADQDEDLYDGGCYIHSWDCRNDDLFARVAFDQIPKKGWHELSSCYRGNGWTLVNRNVVEAYGGSGESWNYVVTILRLPTGEKAVLAFSIFDQYGDAIQPPEDLTKPSDVVSMIRDRIDRTDQRLYPDGRSCLQCQVLADIGEVEDSEAVAAVAQLHLASREIFRNTWLKGMR